MVPFKTEGLPFHFKYSGDGFQSAVKHEETVLCSENMSNDSTRFIPFYEARYKIIIINLDENL